jgi:hypothetical protein
MVVFSFVSSSVGIADGFKAVKSEITGRYGVIEERRVHVYDLHPAAYRPSQASVVGAGWLRRESGWLSMGGCWVGVGVVDETFGKSDPTHYAGV